MNSPASLSDRATLEVKFLVQSPRIDGRIDETFWADAHGVELRTSQDRGGEVPAEGGRVALGWNHAGLYLAARLVDSELVATRLRDEEMHYRYGDVLELFVKPLFRPCYWEMYVTPAGNKSTLYFRRPLGEIQPDPLTGHDFRGLRVAAARRGAGAFGPAGWDAEMWVPAGQLATSGEPWNGRGEWSAFIGRYNHRASLEDPELSMWPAASRTNYHLTNEYAVLRFAAGD